MAMDAALLELRDSVSTMRERDWELE